MWNRRLRRLAGDRGGTSAVEFAILAPVLIALLLGALQLGWALHCNQSVDWAVQTATHQLVGTPTLTQDQIKAQVQSLLTGVIDSSQVTVTLTEDPTTSSPRLAHVAATYAHTIGVPFLPQYNYVYSTTSAVVLSP